MQKIVVFGRNGQVARALQDAAVPPGVRVVALSRAEADITKKDSVMGALDRLARDGTVTAVINAAAYTAVDLAESDEAQAYAVNAQGAGHVAAACRAQGVPLLHLSTDYIFDGEEGRPYAEEDKPRPLNAYGRTKLAGEQAVREALGAHIVVRTSWVYAPYGRNFVRTMIGLAGERDHVRIVGDQTGCPTYAGDIATALLGVALQLQTADAARESLWGTYHYAGKGAVTWHGFAQGIFSRWRAYGHKVPEIIESIPSSAYPAPARRPHYTALDCRKIESAFGLSMVPWPRGLDECIRVILKGAG